MKRLSLIVALALSALVASPAFGAGAETVHFSFTGQSASAFFESVDPSGCAVTDVFVFAVDGRVKEAGRPTVSSEAEIIISQFDVCTDTLLLAAEGSATLAADEFQIDRQLTTATLDTTIEVFSLLSDMSYPVDVSVSWTGVGPTSRLKDHFQIKDPVFKFNVRFAGTFRDAEASGTVSDGTTNFAPEPAIFANFASVKNGEVVIIH